LEAYERVLAAVERKVAEGLIEYERTNGESVAEPPLAEGEQDPPEDESSVGTQRRCRLPWFCVQPIIRPLPTEALKNGAITLSKKGRGKTQEMTQGKKTQEKEQEERQEEKGKEEDIKARDEAVAG
jgi:tRNA-dihydrouridine synthase 1